MENVRYSLYVSTLGKFSVSASSAEAGAALAQGSPGDVKLRRRSFFQYLCVFHHRAVSQEEVIDAIFDSEDGVSDPVNTLKNTLYRTRRLLEELGFSDTKKLLLYRDGFFSWSPDIQITLDIEEFDELYNRFYEAEHRSDHLDSALKALSLYNGEFLMNSANSLWAMSLRTYYHGKYMKLAKEVAEILYEQNRWKDSMRICQMVAAEEPFNEENQLLLMKLLHASGMTQQAVHHYEKIRKMFMDQLGVSPSPDLSDFYKMLIHSKENREFNLTVIRDQMLEGDSTDGAYYCDYSVFQSIYRLIARSMPRNGQAIQLVMTTLNDASGELLSPKRCGAPMEELYKAIHQALRNGDVFTQYSRDQYLILLMSSSYENAAAAMERVLRLFRMLENGKIRVQYSILPVLAPRVVEKPVGWSAIKKR